MSLRAVTIEQFPGLDLRTDPGDSRGAIDLLNVTLEPGRVRTRDGSALLYTASFRPPQIWTYERGLNSPYVILAESGGGGTSKMTAITSAGALVASSAGTTVGVIATISACHIGTTAANYMYFANPAIGTLTRWDGTLWTFPAIPAAVAAIGLVNINLGLSPTDNRMAYGINDTVFFSDPGAPETVATNNFVRLTPGDGESIAGMGVYNNMLFVFKRTKFFVFYGTSTDTTGSPIFNYRTVNNQGGLILFSPQAVCPCADGLYFIAEDGIYRTTGGDAVKVSAPLDPFFTGVSVPPYWLGGTKTRVAANVSHSLCYVNNCLYAVIPTAGSTAIVFIYDFQTGTWTAWDATIGAIAQGAASASANDVRRLVWANLTTAVARADPTLAADSGTAIVSRYRLPFETYGTPGEKKIRQTIVEGTGAPTVQWSRDWGALGTGSAVTLGTSPAIAVGRQRLAVRGRAFSLQVGAASGAWAVNRVQPELSDAIRPVSVTV